MEKSHRSGLLVGLLLVSWLQIGSTGLVTAQDEGGSGIIEGIFGGLKSGGAGSLEERARTTASVGEARDLYETLVRRHRTTPSGVRAALWMGRDAYGTGRIEEALRYFEMARKNAENPALLAEATFWCELSRSLSGHEPLAIDSDRAPGGFWETLTRLTRVDRALHQGDKRDAELSLLSLEGVARRDQVLGLCVARWADISRMEGASRLESADLASWLSAPIDFPERLRLERPVEEVTVRQETWALLFGDYLDGQSARLRQKEIGALGIEAEVKPFAAGGQNRFHVLLGPFETKAEAETTAASVPDLSTADYLIIRSP